MLKRDFLGDQKVQPVIGEEQKSLFEPPSVRPARAMRRGNLPDLRRD